MSERKSISEMVSDGLREAGVLISVFGSFDLIFKDAKTDNWWLEIIGWVVLGISIFSVGMILERKKQ